MRTSRSVAVVALWLVGLTLIVGCESPQSGDRDGARVGAAAVAVDGPPQIVYSFTLPYSRWKKDGVDINITSTKQSVVVDGEAMASKDDATVHLIYDGKEANLIVDATGKADEAKPIPVHGEKLDKADLLPKGARKLTLLPDAKTSVDDKTLFTVTITEIDPM